MTGRVTRFVAKLSLVLLVGCLSREDGPRSLWQPPRCPPSPCEPMPAPPALPRELASDYQARPAPPVARQTSMALDPAVTRTRAEVQPAAPPPVVPPPKPEPPVVAALRRALEKHPDEARRLLDSHEKTDRELLFALLRLTACVSAREVEKLGPEEVAPALEHLSSLSAQLRRKAPLALDHVCFCRAIEGFGRYRRLPTRHAFQAGSDGRPGERVQVYAEVRNFGSRRAGEQYETVLESRLEIRDAQRRKVVTLDLGRSPDRSHSPRQDYFLSFEFHVPPKLPPGLYTLWVTVKDVTDEGQAKAGARQAACSLDFTVCPPGAEASGDAGS